jgi:hypothetical protein
MSIKGLLSFFIGFTKLKKKPPRAIICPAAITQIPV